jgi:hypothetical protein
MSSKHGGGPFGHRSVAIWTVIAGVVALLTYFGLTPGSLPFLRSVGPTPTSILEPTPTQQNGPDEPTLTNRPKPTPTSPKGVPEELIGYWKGGGHQYAGDNYYMDIEITFTADGEYSMLYGGISKEQGRFEVNGSNLVFRPTEGQPYAWSWGITQFSGHPVLNLGDPTRGGTYSLDKI